MEFLFIASMKKKNIDHFICHPSSFSILACSSRKAVKEAPVNFPQKNKGFINNVFCTNWDVKNPSWTRLDSSSLVKKQVKYNNKQVSSITRLLYPTTLLMLEPCQTGYFSDSVLYGDYTLLSAKFTELKQTETCERLIL